MSKGGKSHVTGSDLLARLSRGDRRSNESRILATSLAE